ncbi:Solute carrier family 2, facilitated glucose transporter member 1 [Aphelenchoides bicaudatus]|nr:Solute carrier family 2, facilitated glucose transporter member 1 [Aphelenchoides bicaudatus]
MITRWNTIKLFIICSALTSITNFPSAFTNSSVNTAVHEVRNFLNTSFALRDQHFSTQTHDLIHSTILNVWFAAQIFGSIIAPWFTDKLGRKAGYLFSTFIMTCGSAIQFLAIHVWSPELLMLGRFVAALCSPLSDACLILYLQECSPIQLRGAFSFLGEIGYCLMCVLGMVLGMRSVLGDSLKKLLGFSILPGALSMIFLFMIPETPKYLMITKRNRVKALKSLQYYQGEKKENDRILDDFMRESTLDDAKKRSSIREVLSTWHLRFAVLLALAVLVQTLSYYPILNSSTKFFEHIGVDSELAEFSSTGLFVAFTLACLFGSLFIDRYPRRFLVLSSGALAILSLSLFVLFSMLAHLHVSIKFIAMASLYLYAITFGACLGPLSWFIAPELVTQRHRSTLFCLCYGLNNILIAITNFSVTSMYSRFGPIIMVPFLIVPSILCLVFIYFYLPETLGKETHEIVHEIRCIKKRKCAADPEDSNSSSSSEDSEESEQKNPMV